MSQHDKGRCKGELNKVQLKQNKCDVFKLGNLLKRAENDELPPDVKSIYCRREWLRELSLHCHGRVHNNNNNIYLFVLSQIKLKFTVRKEKEN